MILLFLKGLIAGLFCPFLSISVALLVANLHLKASPKVVRAGVLGLLATNMVFVIIASFGLHLAMISLKADYRSFSMVGAIVLFLLALRFYKASPSVLALEFTPPSAWHKGFLFCLLFAASFPMTIIEYAAIYAALGVHSSLPPLLFNFFIILGTFMGMLVWWAVYLSILKKTTLFSPGKLIETCSRLSALILVCFSLVGLIQIYFK